MKITSMGKMETRFTYHEPEANVSIEARDYSMGSGVEIENGEGITYTIRLDDVGNLVIHAYGRGFEHLNISPRSSNEIRLSCEVWRPA